MSDFFNAFEMSPVPAPGPDAVAPDPFRGIYGMPMFVTIPTDDLEASADFWVRGLGFIELFGIPGQVVHLRRWAFQDVLLVPATADTATTSASGMRVSFSGVLHQLDPVAAACRALRPGNVTGPRDTPWNTRDVEVITPEGVRVVLTAARPFDPESAEGRYLASVGIVAPDTAAGDDNGVHG
ncbi:VOC family protein [Actinomadura citrea]|uniref:VOC family protein n=1 Tax=Actinomadura citrea TaxID=46158 RepID=UPI002E2B9172|nr:VOC family protein [Actinomadura citrea]